MPVLDKAAFRCRNCGHLEGPEAAGENDRPHACSVCGAGITLNPRTAQLAQEIADPATTQERRVGIAQELTRIATVGENDKEASPDNWEVLDEFDDEGLASIGLTREQVTAPNQEVEVEGAQGEKMRVPVRRVAAGPIRGTRVGVQASDTTR